MNTERLKMTNIISSILSIMLKRKATKVDIQVENTDIEARINISGNMEGLTKEEVEGFRKKLDNARSMDLEEPYWELSDTLEEENLYLLGVMIDSFHLDFDGEYMHLTLIRKKEGTTEVE